MGKIFCLIGKSSTGKDTIYRELFERGQLDIRRLVPYTTRPIRDGETDGREYFFCTEEKVQELLTQGKIIELREYQTVYGPWKYFTACDGQIDLAAGSYVLIGTLEVYERIRDYFGKEHVLPIYIEVEDGERLIRAIGRERKQDTPKYAEMCRRFLADDADYSEENLKKAGITRRFLNTDLETTIQEVEAFIRREVEAHAN